MISVALAMVLAFFGCGHREGLEGVCYKDHESKMTKWKNSHCLMRVMCYTLCPSPLLPSPPREDQNYWGTLLTDAPKSRARSERTLTTASCAFHGSRRQTNITRRSSSKISHCGRPSEEEKTPLPLSLSLT